MEKIIRELKQERIMSDEMLLESVPFESDESEDSESDEAFAEAEDSDEDFGEARSSRSNRRLRRMNRYLPVRRGVSGMRLRGPDGQVRNLPFPTKLATAAETNRGLASQEVGRRALAERLEKLESGIRVNQKKDGAVSGTVYLAVGGGLTAFSLFKASQRPVGDPFLSSWANEQSAQMATLASATQVVTSGAKWLINGKYHRSGVGIVADVFSLLQIAGFTFASLFQPPEEEAVIIVDKLADLDATAKGAAVGALIFVRENSKVHKVHKDTLGNHVGIPQP
jgi:hypothetical protein